MWELKVAKTMPDEWMVIRQDENENTEYLTRKLQWSKWKVDGKVFFHEGDAASALVIKRRKGETDIPLEESPVEKAVKDSWSDYLY